MNQKKSKNPLWYGESDTQKRRMFKFRVSNLVIGDALVCDESSWRVDCGEDKNRLGERQFIVKHKGEELVRRKRLDSVVEYLLSNGAPPTLEYVERGATHLIQANIADEVELLGFLPTYEDVVSMEGYRQRRFTQARIEFHDLKLSVAHKAIHDIVRFVVQNRQAVWFDPSFAIT